MYVKKSDAENLLKNELTGLLDSIRAKNHLIAYHSEGDDWSFVIKTQTLIESAVTNAVLSKIGENGLQKIFKSMPLVGDGASKLNFSKELDITTSAQRRFITTLASLRNQLAHNPDYGDFTFDSYISGLNNNQRKEWQQAIHWFSDSPSSKDIWAQNSLKTPKPIIYTSAIILIAILELNSTEISVLRRINELSIETTTDFLRLIEF